MDDRLITGTVLYQEPMDPSLVGGWLLAATVLAGVALWNHTHRAAPRAARVFIRRQLQRKR